MMMESSDATGIKLIRPCDVHKMQLKSEGCLANDILTLTSVSLFLCNSNYDSIYTCMFTRAKRVSRYGELI